MADKILTVDPVVSIIKNLTFVNAFYKKIL